MNAALPPEFIEAGRPGNRDGVQYDIPPMPQFPRYAVVAGLLLPLLMFAWLLWSIFGQERIYQSSQHQASQAAHLSGSLVQIDEMLSMMVAVAAGSGDVRWLERYRDQAARFQTALAEMQAVAPENLRPYADAVNQSVGRRPGDIEMRLLDMVRSGQSEEAVRLLDGAEYRRFKETNRTALLNMRNAFVVAAEQRRDSARLSLNHLEGVAAFGLALVVALWGALLWLLLHWRSRLITAYDARLKCVERQFVTYIQAVARTMSAMTGTLTASTRQLRDDCQAILSTRPSTDIFRTENTSTALETVAAVTAITPSRGPVKLTLVHKSLAENSAS